nr:MAG TPA: protein of unknown function DUF4376 [Caudoviricetes sp.]
MEETTICPGYKMPTETDGTPADYSAIEAAVNAHNQNAQPGEAYWGIRLCGAEYEVYEYGEVPQPPTAEELLEQLKHYKETKIKESKDYLSTYLVSHPLFWSDGKYYSVTSEKQALLTSNLALYQISTAAGQPFKLTWNSTGDECVEWTYDDLAALALAIGTYVKPFVSHQQELEICIKACTTIEEVDAIAITYETPKESTDTTEPTEETTEGDTV